MQKKILSVVIDGEKERIEIAGSPVDIMSMTNDMLSACLKGLENIRKLAMKMQ